MKYAIFAHALAACAFLALSAGSAQAQYRDRNREPAAELRGGFIRCPLQTARRTITDDLPEGWWTTPLVNRLTSTRIQNIAGRPALLCVYGESGSIQRNPPRGVDCVAVEGGFRCRGGFGPGGPGPGPGPGPGTGPGAGGPDRERPVTHSTGELRVPQTYLFDLDQGSVGGAGATADLWFEAETAARIYLTPRNGAQIWVGDRSNRGYRGCSRGGYSASRVPMSALPVGSYICVRTNAGRISQFRVNALTPRSPRTLTIGYTTWQN